MLNRALGRKPTFSVRKKYHAPVMILASAIISAREITSLNESEFLSFPF